MANLLDRASVVLTPTAYNNGEALCIKPDDASGDFDFSRNSAATRVNAQGLVENVQILSSNLVQNGDFSEEGAEEVSNGNFSQEGSELVTNGGFATDTDWTKQTSWSISGGSANYDFLSDAKYIRQTLLNGGFVSGKTYKINFEITSGTAYMNVNSNGGGLISLNTYSVGSYSIYVTASASGSDLLIYGRNTSGTAFSIDNVSVREVGQDWNLIGTATITENQANIVTTSAVTGISQSNILTIGKSYKLSYNIVSNNNGGLKISGNEIPSVVGNNIYYFEASAAALEILRNSGITDISITNISVKEVGQNWTLGTGWSIGDGVAIFDYDTSISKIFTSNLNLNLNNSYRLSFEIKNVLSGTPNIFIANSGGSVGYNGNYTNYSEGVHTLIFSPSSNQTTLSFFARYSDFSITNISVIEITDDTNLPRINYEGFSFDGSGNIIPDSGCGSWLFEPQSTNLVPYSEDFSQWDVINTPIITSNYGVSPDGTQNADRLQMNTNDRIYTSVPASGNTAFSVYLKGSGIITLRDSTNVYRQDVTLTSEWERYSLYFNATSNTVQIQNQKVGDVDCEIWGAQVEALSYPTSYIPTDGSTVTRNQDVCTNGATGTGLINSTEGVLYAEIARSEEQNLYRLLGIDDGTSNNYVKMGFENSRGAFWIRAVINGVTSISSDNALTSNPNEFYKIAIRYQSGNSAIYINGTSVLTTTTTFSSGNFTALDFNHWNNSLNFFGKTKCVAVWQEALSDSELQSLTTI